MVSLIGRCLISFVSLTAVMLWYISYMLYQKILRLGPNLERWFNQISLERLWPNAWYAHRLRLGPPVTSADTSSVLHPPILFPYNSTATAYCFNPTLSFHHQIGKNLAWADPALYGKSPEHLVIVLKSAEVALLPNVEETIVQILLHCLLCRNVEFVSVYEPSGILKKQSWSIHNALQRMAATTLRPELHICQRDGVSLGTNPFYGSLWIRWKRFAGNCMQLFATVLRKAGLKRPLADAVCMEAYTLVMDEAAVWFSKPQPIGSGLEGDMGAATSFAVSTAPLDSKILQAAVNEGLESEPLCSVGTADGISEDTTAYRTLDRFTLYWKLLDHADAHRDLAAALEKHCKTVQSAPSPVETNKQKHNCAISTASLRHSQGASTLRTSEHTAAANLFPCLPQQEDIRQSSVYQYLSSGGEWPVASCIVVLRCTPIEIFRAIFFQCAQETFYIPYFIRFLRYVCKALWAATLSKAQLLCRRVSRCLSKLFTLGSGKRSKSVEKSLKNTTGGLIRSNETISKSSIKHLKHLPIAASNVDFRFFGTFDTAEVAKNASSHTKLNEGLHENDGSSSYGSTETSPGGNDRDRPPEHFLGYTVLRSKPASTPEIKIFVSPDKAFESSQLTNGPTNLAFLKKEKRFSLRRSFVLLFKAFVSFVGSKMLLHPIIYPFEEEGVPPWLLSEAELYEEWGFSLACLQHCLRLFESTTQRFGK